MDEWICKCGQRNTANFCSNCGRAKKSLSGSSGETNKNYIIIALTLTVMFFCLALPDTLS